jgi:peptidoglycan/xylan/chitin deacetylase (PgdA/CDA1 family)
LIGVPPPPDGRRAAVAVTFDNLGEASELERGQRSPGEPLGSHFSVTRALPVVLGLLSELQLHGTFFVEGINAEVYPEALRTIDAEGHEVGYHGWRHEVWAELDPGHERELLARGVDAFGALGLRPVGFRPPGGELGASSPAALVEAGFEYCSPAGEDVEAGSGLVMLPFQWALIDAFHYLPHFGKRRQGELGIPEVLPPERFRARAGEALRETARRGGFLALLFHPFLAVGDDRLEAIRAVLADLRALIDEHAVWCAPMREIAAWIREQAG